ncbi:hypothetical protein RRG08_007478 [Elysia crispata]|uniref:Uncharacterized protein n=1 Tax=Elysia crispata TaxID=231223 RepID=A0AAE0XN57_9GAST|nr:hypothetical protein RRG08_007478 [Elysia crispata]
MQVVPTLTTPTVCSVRQASPTWLLQQFGTARRKRLARIIGPNGSHVHAATLSAHRVDARYAVLRRAKIASQRHMRTVDFKLILRVKIISGAACRQVDDKFFFVCYKPSRQTSLSSQHESLVTRVSAAQGGFSGAGSVIGSLRPSVVFGCKGILIIFGIFQAYETQRVRLKQVNDSRSCMLLVPQSHPSSANRKTRHFI